MNFKKTNYAEIARNESMKLWNGRKILFYHLAKKEVFSARVVDYSSDGLIRISFCYKKIRGKVITINEILKVE